MTVTNTLFQAYNPKIIHAYDMHVSSCDDCKVCHYKTACKFNDDMTLVNKWLSIADTLVIVSPIYYGGLSDKLMQIINRFQPYFEKKFTHNIPIPTVKNIYLISTCAANNDSMFKGPTITLEILASLFNAKNSRALTLKATDEITDINDTYQDTISAFNSLIKKELT